MIDGHLLCECKIRTTGAGDSTLHRFLSCDLYARFPFYSASALLAMQTSVLARVLDHFCPSVCHSVTLRSFVQTNEDNDHAVFSFR